MADEQRVSQMEEEMNAAINGELEPVVEAGDKESGATKVETAMDNCCKCIFSQRTVIALVLKGIVSEFRDLPIDDIKAYIIDGNKNEPIMNEYIIGDSNEASTMGERDVKFDYTVRARNPRYKETGLSVNIHLDLEGQSEYKDVGYPIEMRAQYYVARMLSRQMAPKKNSDYGKLEKCYSIWFCEKVRVSERNTITRYTMNAESFGNVDIEKEKYGLMDVVIIRLGSDMPSEGYINSELKTLMRIFHKALSIRNAEELKRELAGILTESEYLKCKKEVDKMSSSLQKYGDEREARGEVRGRSEERERIFKEVIERAVTTGKEEDAIYEILVSTMCLSENEAMQYLSKYYKA